MGFNKRYVDTERIVYTFRHEGIYGLRDLFGLSESSRVDTIITQDSFSDEVLEAYQEGREKDVDDIITEEVIKATKK